MTHQPWSWHGNNSPPLLLPLRCFPSPPPCSSFALSCSFAVPNGEADHGHAGALPHATPHGQQDVQGQSVSQSVSSRYLTIYRRYHPPLDRNSWVDSSTMKPNATFSESSLRDRRIVAVCGLIVVRKTTAIFKKERDTHAMCFSVQLYQVWIVLYVDLVAWCCACPSFIFFAPPL